MGEIIAERLDLPQGTLDLLILKTLALGSQHGWAISERIQQVSNDALRIQQGSLYPALHRLERGGLVESSWSAGGGRRRRIYRLTPAGRRAVKESRQEWRAFSTAVDRVLGGTA